MVQVLGENERRKAFETSMGGKSTRQEKKRKTTEDIEHDSGRGIEEAKPHLGRRKKIVDCK